MPHRGNSIPTHALASSREPIQVRPIAHQNHYDFTRQHRHGYFEVMFFLQGGGTNLIDFVEYEVRANACYLIYPGQIHLLRRDPGSHGHLIQFEEAAIPSTKLQRRLQEKAWSGHGAVLFEEDAGAMAQIAPLLHAIEARAQAQVGERLEVLQHLLQALLWELLGMVQVPAGAPAMDAELYTFLQMVDAKFREDQRVTFYLDRLAITEKRLATLTQKSLGTSPLQVIHRRMLLEAKRLLVAGELPHKEIAYDLGFDSPASFSAFIKKKTGLTATEIQAQVTEIHKQ